MGVFIVREMVGTSPRSWSDAARQASFPADELETARKRFLSSLQMELSEPSAVAQRILHRVGGDGIADVAQEEAVGPLGLEVGPDEEVAEDLLLADPAVEAGHQRRRVGRGRRLSTRPCGQIRRNGLGGLTIADFGLRISD